MEAVAAALLPTSCAEPAASPACRAQLGGGAEHSLGGLGRRGDTGCETSGVSVADDVIRVFNDMKVRKSSTCEDIKKRKKAIIFCLSEDKKTIIIECGKELLVGDLKEGDDPYKLFIDMLPKEDCRYALYDATYETKESKKEDLVFLFWAPEGAPLKSKMIYASSKDAVKKKLTGIKFDWQANTMEDIKDRCTLACKLGGATVITLEGMPV